MSTGKYVVASRDDATKLTTIDGDTISLQDAQSQGYEIVDPFKGHRKTIASVPKITVPGLGAAISAAVRDHSIRRSAVLALPEAVERPSAALALASNSDISIQSAAQLLRGLPTEKDTTDMTTTAPTASAADVQHLVRLTQIRATAFKLRAEKYGDERAGIEAKKLSYALSIYGQGGLTIAESLTAARLDARATISSLLGIR